MYHSFSLTLSLFLSLPLLNSSILLCVGPASGDFLPRVDKVTPEALGLMPPNYQFRRKRCLLAIGVGKVLR
jgi:hypothetical protein